MIEKGKDVKVEKAYLLENQKENEHYDLTLVVPAFNEEKRLPKMMKETVEVRLVYLVDNTLVPGKRANKGARKSRNYNRG